MLLRRLQVVTLLLLMFVASAGAWSLLVLLL
jgi:hypothetical protein